MPCLRRGPRSGFANGRTGISRQQVGIGTVVMRNKQYLAAIRPRDTALALSTMHFADEVVPKSDLDFGPPTTISSTAKELRLAGQIIDVLSTKWDPRRYKDTYTDQVKGLIEAQAKGKPIAAEAPAQGAQVVDLMAALEASLKAAREHGGSPTSGPRGRRPAAPGARARAGRGSGKVKAARPEMEARPRREGSKSRTRQSFGPDERLTLRRSRRKDRRWTGEVGEQLNSKRGRAATESGINLEMGAALLNGPVGRSTVVLSG